MGDLLVSERSSDGVSWLPPTRSLFADTTRELIVVEDVLLKRAFPHLLPAGASARPSLPVWWPTQTNRQGDGDPLRPHVVARGGIQINRRGRALADEALRREAVDISLEQNTCLRVKRLP